MITINFTADDLNKLRFAYRPLLEIPLSFRVLINPAFQDSYIHWVDEAKGALYDADLPYLSSLVTPDGYIPDFMTPTPLVSRLDVNADIAEMVATPDTIIQKNILTLIRESGDSERRRYFLVNPREAVQCLAAEMRLYWRRVLAHYWSRMVSTLEGDILYRARLMALDGPEKVMNDLHPTITYRNAQIDVGSFCQCVYEPAHMHLDGRGLQLVPLIFRGNGRMIQFDPMWPSMLMFGVQGTGLWYRKTLPSTQALELALGAGRASVLQALLTPKSNGELACVLHITTGAVSQHLARLRQAGLVEAHRIGRRLYNQLTPRGEELMRLFERPI